MPSANVLRFLARPSQSTGNILIFGDPTHDLQYAREEAVALAELYNVEPFIGEAATKKALLSQAGQAEILHLAAHGEYGITEPMASRILLSSSGADSDGNLLVYEIYELDLAATRLVVLSACDTQAGYIANGDEVISLNRAFLQAGTPNVMATLWRIDDEATAELMTQFYEFLQQGMSSAEALQRSQQAIKAQERFAHPYYWAAFSITGNGQ